MEPNDKPLFQVNQFEKASKIQIDLYNLSRISSLSETWPDCNTFVLLEHRCLTQNLKATIVW